MIDCVIEQTNLYIGSMPKKDRKNMGSFYKQETAMYMAGLFSITEDKDTLTVLDAGSGSGILSCTFIEVLHAFIEVLQRKKKVKKVNLTCYETDNNILAILQHNLEYIKNNAEIELEYEIKTDNYKDDRRG